MFVVGAVAAVTKEPVLAIEKPALAAILSHSTIIEAFFVFDAIILMML